MESLPHVDYTLKAKDGTDLYGRGYRAEPYRPDRVAVIAHGVGEHSGRYENLVQALLEHGVSVYACDFRGFGKSSGLRGHARGIGELVSDLSDFLSFLDRTENVHRPALIGHSMGALVSLSFAQRRDAINRILCFISSGAPLYVKLDSAMRMKLILGKLVKTIHPRLRMKTGISSQLLSHDKSEVEDYRHDELVHSYVSATLGVDLLEAGDRILRHAEKIELPLLLLHGGADALANPKSSQIMMDRVSSRLKKLIIYDGLYHEIFNELPEQRAAVIQDLTAWLDEQFARNV